MSQNETPVMDIDSIATSINRIAESIIPPSAVGAPDATGTNVTSLTEAVMGLTASASSIADAINNLAEATREQRA
jgi:ABC-type transporter Mla subunit MlaD